MSLTVYEGVKSRANTLGTDSASKTAEYVALYSASENDVQAAVLLVSPLYAFGVGGIPLRRKSVKCDPLGGGVWRAAVEYEFTSQVEEVEKDDETQDDQKVGPAWSGDTSGATAHVTQSIRTRVSRALGDAVGTESSAGTAPDFVRAIGVDKETVHGCDVVVPNNEFQVTVNVPGLTFGQVRTFGRLVGKTNNAAWKGFQVGEVQYLGGPWSIQPAELAKVTHKFRFGEILERGDPALVVDPRVSPNGIVLPRKRPFDYVWCTYLNAVDVGLPVQRPQAAYVEQVCREGDFTLLGMGG